MARGRTIVCVGRLYADLVMTGLPRLPRLGREEYAEDMLVTPGGGAFITAAYLAGLGRQVHLAEHVEAVVARCTVGPESDIDAVRQQRSYRPASGSLFGL